jgi:hypothetical protein
LARVQMTTNNWKIGDMAVIVRGCAGNLWEPILGHVFTVSAVSHFGQHVALTPSALATFQMTDGRKLALYLVPAAFCQKIEGLQGVCRETLDKELVTA